MADYQEYRRRILHRRWRRMFITAALLILLVLLAAVGVLWKRLHREPAPNTAQGPTILQQELTGSEWNTISYTPARRLSVQTLDNGMTAMDFRLAAQPASPAVERSSFSDVSFLGDSLTQGMQLYDTGLPNAHFCAYKASAPMPSSTTPPAAGPTAKRKSRWSAGLPAAPGALHPAGYQCADH